MLIEMSDILQELLFKIKLALQKKTVFFKHVKPRPENGDSENIDRENYFIFHFYLIFYILLPHDFLD